MTPKEKALERSKEALLRLIALSADEWDHLKLHCPNLIKQLPAVLASRGIDKVGGTRSIIIQAARTALAFYDSQKRPMDEGEVEILDTLEAALVAAEGCDSAAAARPLPTPLPSKQGEGE